MVNNKPHFSFENNTKKWESTSLGNVLKINSGRDYKHLGVGEVPVYGTGGYMLSVNQSLSEEDAIGIGRKGTIDKPQLLHAPFWTVDTLFFMSPQKNNDLYFLYTYMQKIKWKNYDESSGVPSLSKLNIEKINMFIPDDEVQTKIGTFFKSLDDTISLHQQELEALKQTKQGFLQKMFPQEGQTMPTIRFNEFKENWEKYSLGQIGKIRSGVGFPEVEQQGKEGIPFYKVSDLNLKDNNIEMTKANNYVTNQQIKIKKWSVIEELPAIIFAKVGAALMLNRKKLVTSPFLLDNNLMSYSFDSDWDAYFGYSLFQTLFLPKYAQVGALPSFNGSDISTIEIYLPSLDEQYKIGEFFRQLDEVIELKEKELEALKETKKGFLQKMFV